MASVALEEVLSYVSQQASKYGVDANHAQAILLAENMGGDGGIPAVLDTSKVSPRGATGVMQVMPTTRTNLLAQGHLSEEHSQSGDWQSDVNAGLAALKEIQGRTKTKDPRVLAAEYNAGPKGGKIVSEGSTEGLPSETINYLKRFEFAQGWLQGIPNPSGVTRVSKSITGPETLRSTSTTSVANMDAINQMLQNNSIWTAEAVRMVTGSLETEAGAHMEAATQAAAAGQAAGFAKQMEGMIDAAGAQARQRILAILNLNTSKVDNAVSSAAAEFQQLDTERRSRAALINKKLQIGFFDNPLEYLINATQLPGLVEGHNAVVRGQNDAVTTLQTMQKIAGDQERIDIAASADQIAELGVARGNAVAAEGNARAAQLKAQSASASARLVTTVAGLKEKEFDNAYRAAILTKTMEGYREGDEKKGKEAEEERQLDADLRRIGTMVGAPNMSLQVLKRMHKKEQQEWLDRVASNNIGNNLYEALTFLKPGNLDNIRASGSAALAESVKRLQKVAFDNAQLKAANMNLTGQKVPPREQFLQQVTGELEGEFFATSTDMLIAKSYNPYLANHVAMATDWRGNPENIVAKTVREGVKNKIRYNDAQLFSAVSKLVRDGAIQPRDAAQQMADYYTASIARNNKAFSYKLLGLPDQDDYKILPKELKKAVNLANPAELDTVFTRMRAIASIRSMGGAAQGFYIPQELQQNTETQ